MEEITVPCVIAVLKEAMTIDKDFTNEALVSTNKKCDAKLELIKCGFKYALTELENHPHLKAPYDLQVLQSASSSTGVTRGDMDARIKFGEMLIFLFENLTKAIVRKNSVNERQDMSELSLGQHNLVNRALVCLNKIAVLPYIPDGIGRIMVDHWWKSTEWKKILEDRNYQSKQLHLYLITLFDLMDVSFQVKGTVVARELDMIMMAAEVLNHLGDTSLHVKYRSFLKNVDPLRVLDEASLLVRPTDDNNCWFNVSMSNLVSEMVASGHLVNLFRVYRMRDKHFKEGSSSGNVPFLQSVAFCLLRGRCPSMSSKDYASRIVDQFFQCLVQPVDCKEEIIIVFNFYIDAMYNDQQFLIKSLILDRFFLPLEKLNKGESQEDLHLIPQSIRLLAVLLADNKCQSSVIARSPRFRKFFFLLVTIAFELASEDTPFDKNDMANFRKDLITCITAVMKSIPRKELLLLWIVRQPEYIHRVELKAHEKAVSNKIQVVGERNEHVWQFPYGKLYVEVHPPASPLETAHLVKDIAQFMITMQESVEEKVEFGYASLFEIFKSYIHGIGGINRLSEHEKYEDPKAQEDHFHLYSGRLLVLADTINECIFQELGADDEGVNASIQKYCTLDKLLQLTILTTTNVVENLQKEVARQDKEASLDVKVAPSERDEKVGERLKHLIMSTAAYGIKFASLIPLMKMLDAEKMKRLDNEVNEIIRLTALLKKVLGEMKEVPKELELLKKSFEKDESLNSVIAGMEGSVQLDGEKDSSYFDADELLELLGGYVHEKGQALFIIGKLLRKRNTRLLQMYDPTFHGIIMGLISSWDSYVYLAAINCAAEAALAMTDKIIPFVKMFSHVTSKRETYNCRGVHLSSESMPEKVVVRLRIAAVICKVFDLLDTAAPLYAREAIGCVLPCATDLDGDIRASTFAIMEHLFKSMAHNYSIDQQLQPVLDMIKHTLLHEKEAQVRRNAAQILTQILRGAGKEMITRLSETLRDINRLVSFIIMTEKDDVVLLHAQLAKEEIKASINEKLFEEMNEMYRNLNF